MPRVFSAPWMKSLSDTWNSDSKMVENLSKVGFDANIGFGYIDGDRPRGFLEVRQGKVVNAGDYIAQSLDWDLRAKPEDWRLWMTEGFGLTRLGFTTATGRLRFVEGNYRQMVRNPALARPFLRIFELMAEIETEW